MNNVIRQRLSQWQKALLNHDEVTYRSCQQQIKREIKNGKRNLGKQVGDKFQSDIKSGWNMFRSLLKLKDRYIECFVDIDGLNEFFARFESDNVQPILLNIDPCIEMFSVNQVCQVLRTVHISKGSDPDIMPARVI